MIIKILIVEDNDEFRGVLRNFLETQNLDFEIYETSSGELAITEALAKRPEIILMDVRLPQMNGIEAAKHIKMKLPESKIIILTMFELPEFEQSNQHEIVSAFVSKGELYDRLIPVMQKCLNGKHKKDAYWSFS